MKNIIIVAKNAEYNLEERVYIKVDTKLEDNVLLDILRTSPYKHICMPKHIRGSRVSKKVHLGFKNAPIMSLEETIRHLNGLKIPRYVTVTTSTPYTERQVLREYIPPYGIRISEVKYFWDKTFITFSSDLPYFRLDEKWHPDLDKYRRVMSADHPNAFYREGEYFFEEEVVSEHQYRYKISKYVTLWKKEEYTKIVLLK